MELFVVYIYYVYCITLKHAKMNNLETTKMQVKILEEKFSNYKPHPSTGKYDSGYYALRNKIKRLKMDIASMERRINNFNWLAR